MPADLESFWTTLGFALIQGYGMTETTALVTLNHPFKIARGSIGKPLAGREVKIGADGEILVRGDSIAAQEWRNGRLQPRAADWLATGDLATRNDAGRAGLRRAQERRHRHFRRIEHPSPGSGGGAAPAARGAGCVDRGLRSAAGPAPAAVLIAGQTRTMEG